MPYDGSGLDETTKVLLEARRLVEKGWCQGVYADPAGRVCLHRALALGSLAAAGISVSVEWERAFIRVIALIPPCGARANDRVQWWNDDPQRTQAEVLALLDRAIAGGDA